MWGFVIIGSGVLLLLDVGFCNNWMWSFVIIGCGVLLLLDVGFKVSLIVLGNGVN